MRQCKCDTFDFSFISSSLSNKFIIFCARRCWRKIYLNFITRKQKIKDEKQRKIDQMLKKMAVPPGQTIRDGGGGQEDEEEEKAKKELEAEEKQREKRKLEFNKKEEELLKQVSIKSISAIKSCWHPEYFLSGILW